MEEKKINGHHIIKTGEEIANERARVAAIPEQLLDMKKDFTRWLPLTRKVRVGAMLRAGIITEPRVALRTVWPAFAAWMITNERYGVIQWLPNNKKLHDIAREIANVLEMQAAGHVIGEERLEGLAKELLPHGANINDNHHPGAGDAWQCVYNAAEGIAPLALRHGISANRHAQPGEKNVAVMACINMYLGKLLELLKLGS